MKFSLINFGKIEYSNIGMGKTNMKKSWKNCNRFWQIQSFEILEFALEFENYRGYYFVKHLFAIYRVAKLKYNLNNIVFLLRLNNFENRLTQYGL